MKYIWVKFVWETPPRLVALSGPYFPWPSLWHVVVPLSPDAFFRFFFHEKLDFLIFGRHCSRMGELHQCHASDGEREPVTGTLIAGE